MGNSTSSTPTTLYWTMDPDDLMSYDMRTPNKDWSIVERTPRGIRIVDAFQQHVLECTPLLGGSTWKVEKWKVASNDFLDFFLSQPGPTLESFLLPAAVYQTVNPQPDSLHLVSPLSVEYANSKQACDTVWGSISSEQTFLGLLRREYLTDSYLKRVKYVT